MRMLFWSMQKADTSGPIATLSSLFHESQYTWVQCMNINHETVVTHYRNKFHTLGNWTEVTEDNTGYTMNIYGPMKHLL